jgi:DNA repair photolyase
MDFETRLFAKPDAAARLREELRAKSYRVSPIAIGTNTDAYQPLESRMHVMRDIVTVLAECRHPFAITTKSALVARDRDLLGEMAAQGLVKVVLSVTTLDRDLARRLEPRASPPVARLKAVTALRNAGVPVIVNVAPIILGLTDHEMESILAAAADAGALAAGFTMLRLPREVAGLFQGWLAEHAPDRAARVESLVRQTRGGALYQSQFGTRMTGTGPLAKLTRDRFHLACRKHNLSKDRLSPLRTDLFRPPLMAGDQMSFL